MKVRRIKLGSAAEFYINDEQAALHNEGGIGSLYELCAPSCFLTSHFQLSPEVDKLQYWSLMQNKKTARYHFVSDSFTVLVYPFILLKWSLGKRQMNLLVASDP